MDGSIFSIYIVIGCFGGIGAITVLLFVGSFVSKSGKCSVFQNKRQSTVANEVRQKVMKQIYKTGIFKGFIFLMRIGSIIVSAP